MPYINQGQRVNIDYRLTPVIEFISTAGDANYAITKLLLGAFDPSSYRQYNEIIGILECCKLEFYRRAVVPYEDIKARTNGDVYSMSVEVDSSH